VATTDSRYTDPREIIDQSKMTAAQIIVVAMTVFLNAMDGFDVLSIAFASPGIAKEWGIAQTALGVVLSMELIGMAFGSILIGGVADKIGRRPTLLACLMVMAVGMLGATTAASPVQLSIWRVFTGVGIGGMLSGTNALVAEFSNKKWRALCISLMVIGYPLGGTFGGMFASRLLAHYAWRSVFYFGATAAVILLPMLFFFVPESVHWLARKQPVNALARVNEALKRLGHAAVASLPEVHESDRKKSVGDIFSPGLIAVTLLATGAYFLHMLSFYFILKWTPKIVSDMGFAASSAGGILTWANFGGALGGAAFGVLTAKIGLKPLTIGILALNAVAVAIFGRTPANLETMAILAAFAGFFGNAGVSGLYSIVAYAFPTHVRATGTGFVIGTGRGGAVLSPILAGFLLEHGSALPTVGMIMGAGSLLGALALIFIKLGSSRPMQTKDRKAPEMQARVA
jgi:benzoate transport